ncbi:AMP-binding protein [Brevibacillus borstelensis]|uniref:AMP-binding protein n=1 Tax=Brevibacillus borstelensis TaxID=45462 RepID=UPI002E22EFAD|nr:AMP-binding protein [Brevibacillus borstelensis]
MNFFDQIEMFAESTAVITDKSEHILYRELLDKADELKKHLDGRCLVFCICENNLAALTGYLGFLRASAVSVMISSSMDSTLLENLVKTYLPQYIWAPKDNCAAKMGYQVVYEFDHYVLLRTGFNVTHSLHADLALLLTTSGSTGSPKLVRLSYKNITSNAESIAHYLRITSADRPITSLPMHYSYGLSIINSHLLRGCSIILTNKTLMDKAFWELLKNHNATTFGGVPYTYEMLKRLRFARMELPSLAVLTQAGGKLSLELCEEFASICEAKNIRFFVMYGQTEATARMSYLPDGYTKTKVGSIGIPIPGGEFWLEDEQGRKITEIGTVGELVYKGENVSMGYANGPEDLVKGDENGGILHTGDLARFDSDGFYYIVGRKKRFLKLFGNRINLAEVEELLLAYGHDCACAGEDDKMKVFITDKERQDEVYRLVSEKTGVHRTGFVVIPVDVIPRNESGKVLYSQLE